MAVLSCRKTKEEEQVEASVSGCGWRWAQASPTTAHTVSSHCGGSGSSEWPSTVLSKPRGRFEDGWDSNLGLRQHALAWTAAPMLVAFLGQGHTPRNEDKQDSKAKQPS